MIVSFWSTHHGQACTTANSVAVACASASEGARKMLLAHTHARLSTLEQCLFSEKELAGRDAGDFGNHGLDALIRLCKNGRLKDAMVPDYAWSILRGSRFDVLPGTLKSIQAENNEFSWILEIVKAAEGFYDTVILDVHSGSSVIETAQVLTASDVCFIGLSQNAHMVQACLSDENVKSLIEKKKCYFLISRYDEDVGLTANDIARKHKLHREAVFTVPYSAGFMQASNKGCVYEFITRHFPQAKSPEAQLMKALKAIISLIDAGGDS